MKLLINERILKLGKSYNRSWDPQARLRKDQLHQFYVNIQLIEHSVTEKQHQKTSGSSSFSWFGLGQDLFAELEFPRLRKP